MERAIHSIHVGCDLIYADFSSFCADCGDRCATDWKSGERSSSIALIQSMIAHDIGSVSGLRTNSISAPETQGHLGGLRLFSRRGALRNPTGSTSVWALGQRPDHSPQRCPQDLGDTVSGPSGLRCARHRWRGPLGQGLPARTRRGSFEDIHRNRRCCQSGRVCRDSFPASR